MALKASFVHANIIARDWRRLARFYEQVFGCRPVPPERDLAGPWLERATGVQDAHIQGIHLRMPGHGEAGPTLEIFQYNHPAGATGAEINRPGITHLAFAVADVEAARRAVLRAGGSQVGETVTVEVPGAGSITFAYLTDPEGNIVEVQHWWP